jgi:triose/dihydroxyacetone kinase / FAD-AMP lyase (cyclizing)
LNLLKFKGLLSAAVAGSVFSSPSAGQILAAIRTVRPPDNCGVLLIVINYTGDRLNFGLALERARSEGIRVEMVVCGDDCSQLSGNRAVGRRGLAGSLFLMKVIAAEILFSKKLIKLTNSSLGGSRSSRSRFIAGIDCRQTESCQTAHWDDRSQFDVM